MPVNREAAELSRDDSQATCRPVPSTVPCRDGQLLLLASLLFLTTAVRADTVLLQNGQKLTGEILRYDESGVAIRLTNARNITKEYTRDEVVGVEADFLPEQITADAAMAKKDYAAAISGYRRAMELERRPWVKDWLRTKLMGALQAAGQWKPAAELFIQASQERDNLELMRLAPLFWRPGSTPSDADKGTAAEWIQSKFPMAQLIAASWLLETDEREKAQKTLERLQTDQQQRIAWMARAQLWRLRAGAAPPDEIKRYHDLVEKMPDAVRGGPQYLLGLAYEKGNEPLEAALAYLWVPFVYEPASELAGDALLRAAIASQQAGLHNDATKLFREVVREYPGTPFAVQANEHLPKTKDRTP
ncbi:MAG: hypothetical protein U1D30_00125 [Planctomycetota bacterium]